MKLNGKCVTDIGNTRDVNQDAIFFRSKEKNGQYFALASVCDGVGGLDYGEIASQTVVKAMEEWFDDVANWIDIAEIEPDVLFAHLKDAVEQWNCMIFDMNVVKQIKMGTTMSLLMIIREYFYVIQVGDSRVYRFEEELQQLTVDATVSRLNSNGRMKGYLSNYMGKDVQLWYTTVEGKIKEKDMFIICSDGLYHFLLEDDIREIKKEYSIKSDYTKPCLTLINRIKERGESDNISVCIIRIETSKRKLWRL